MKRILIFLTVIALLCALLPAVFAQETAFAQEEKYALLSSLMEADIDSLQQAIFQGLITCEELTAFYLERIENYNETYKCFITLADDALEQARALDARLAAGEATGSMFGIPIVVKDNIHVAGYPTTNGEKWENATNPKKTAPFVQNLIDQGAVILGKANMSYRANKATTSISRTVGGTRNAYNVYLSPGGSSGGSAAATALNFCIAGLGTDTRSSLRIPSALNGCVTLRTTVKLIDREGIIIVASRRDTPGAITRTVKDQAILLDAMVGGGSYTENLNPNILQGLRLGIFKELTYRNKSDKEIDQAFAAAVEELKACGAEVVEVSMPEVFSLSEYTQELGGNERINYFNDTYEQWLKDNNVSAVIFPTYLNAPVYSGTDANGKTWDAQEQRWINNCPILSPCTQCPEITVPIGYHSRGAGIGMEIAAGRNQEQLLLDIAYAYTQRYDHREVPQGAPDLYSDYHVAELSQLNADYAAGLWPVPPTEPTTEPTSEPTEAPTTVPPTTAAPTEPPTQEPTEPAATQPSEETGFQAGIWLPFLAAAITLPTAIVLNRRSAKSTETPAEAAAEAADDDPASVAEAFFESETASRKTAPEEPSDQIPNT